MFGDRILLKGFCTLLVPTDYSGRVVYWYVIFNDDGERISSADPRARKIAGSFKLGKHLALADIESVRHVVGWCEEAWNFAGETLYKIMMFHLESSDNRRVTAQKKRDTWSERRI